MGLFSASEKTPTRQERKPTRQERKVAKQEEKAAKQEIEQRNILAQIVLNEANKLHSERHGFYHNLVHNGEDAQGIVRALINTLERSLYENRGLTRDVGLLKADLSQVRVGKDSGTSQEYQKEISDLKRDHSRRAGEYEDKIDRLSGEVSRLESINDAQRWEAQRAHEMEQRSLQEHNAERIRLQKALNAEKEALQRLQREYEDKIHRLVGDVSRLESVNEAQRREAQRAYEKEQRSLQEHYAEKTKLQKALNAEKEALQHLQEERNAEEKRLHSRISELQQQHESEIDRMQQEYESEMGRIRHEHESEEDRMHQEHKSEEDRMLKEHESNQALLRAKMEKMKQDHDSEQKQMRKELEAAHAEETKRLRRDIEAYSKDLLTRDDFKPMLDNEIKGRFLDLAQEIDTLARLEWKPNQKEWTNQVLRRLSGNQRLLKKQILQDSVWVILHENIFCSPFRVFGEEGRRLESQWNDTYEQDSQLDNGCYIWPKPSIDAERWRYATVKECRAALEKPVSEWDPLARLKKGFKTSLDALTQELTSTLGEVSNLDENSVQAAGSIIKKAAKMWLEFGMQRCRILVIVQGSNLKSAEERIQRAQEATLKLVGVPKLKRFGNSKGQDVQNEEIVGECGGEMVEVSMTR